jgi:hypothetical protein
MLKLFIFLLAMLVYIPSSYSACIRYVWGSDNCDASNLACRTECGFSVTIHGSLWFSDYYVSYFGYNATGSGASSFMTYKTAGGNKSCALYPSGTYAPSRTSNTPITVKTPAGVREMGLCCRDIYIPCSGFLAGPICIGSSCASSAAFGGDTSYLCGRDECGKYDSGCTPTCGTMSAPTTYRTPDYKCNAEHQCVSICPTGTTYHTETGTCA